MYDLDSTDVQLLRILRQDATKSSREIAAELHLSARAVRSRIEQLRDAGVIRFSILINRHKIGYSAAADVIAHIEARQVPQLADQIAKFPEVVYISVTMGSQDISIQVWARSIEDIHRFVTEKLAILPGVIRTNTLLLITGKPLLSWMPSLPPTDEPADRPRRRRPPAAT